MSTCIDGILPTCLLPRRIWIATYPADYTGPFYFDRNKASICNYLLLVELEVKLIPGID